MKIIISAQRRGSILAFVLMALIAIIALAVVFFSRTGRIVPGSVPSGMTTETTSGEPSKSEVTTGSVPADDNPASPIPAPQIMPPPPPPVITPDTGHLPPEG